jgi:ketosteroid isomerase-like protein
MRNYLLLWLCINVVLFVGSCASNSGETEEQMIASARELDQKYLEAFNKGDVDAFMDKYWKSPELVSYLPAVMQAKGWQQLYDISKKSFETMKGAKAEFIESNNKVAGDMVIGWGRFTITLPDSASTKIVGRYTDIKTKRDGKWVYILDHGSVPLPPSPHSQ